MKLSKNTDNMNCKLPSDRLVGGASEGSGRSRASPVPPSTPFFWLPIICNLFVSSSRTFNDVQ